MAEAVESTTTEAISSPSPPRDVNGLAAWAAAMSVGELMANNFVETSDAWADYVDGDATKLENVTAVFQNLMNNVFQSMQDSTDYLDEWGDDDNTAEMYLAI